MSLNRNKVASRTRLILGPEALESRQLLTAVMSDDLQLADDQVFAGELVERIDYYNSVYEIDGQKLQRITTPPRPEFVPGPLRLDNVAAGFHAFPLPADENDSNLPDDALAGEAIDFTPAGIPILPGVNTPSEAMALLEKGITEMKFFPAEAAGGIPMLKSIAGPLPQIQFCPTGGVNPKNAADYLSLSNVACVGGSWMAPADLVKAGDWDEITRRALEASALA